MPSERMSDVTYVTIFVTSRRIMRKGKMIDGWQAGFQPKSGVTSESKDEAIAEAKRIAYGARFVVEGIQDAK